MAAPVHVFNRNGPATLTAISAARRAAGSAAQVARLKMLLVLRSAAVGAAFGATVTKRFLASPANRRVPWADDLPALAADNLTGLAHTSITHGARKHVIGAKRLLASGTLEGVLGTQQFPANIATSDMLRAHSGFACRATADAVLADSCSASTTFEGFFDWDHPPATGALAS